jgi:hypothetical protein
MGCVLTQVTYRPARLGLLRKPWLLVYAFVALFAAVMVYVRVDLTIDRQGDRWRFKEESEHRRHCLQSLAKVPK